MNKIKGKSEEPATAPADAAAPPAIEFELSLEDTLAETRRVTPQGAKAPVKGYNPYDTPVGSADASKPKPGASSEAKRKPTDLRKLSEWIRLQRQVEALKKQGPESESGSESE